MEKDTNLETDNHGKILFSKEELIEKVHVPNVVEQDLKRIVSDRLEQCGMYFRVFSRIKTAASMAQKFAMKEYGEDRKLQDLVGVRINLYFDDDVDICRSIMERTFEVLEWSTSQRNEDEFRQTKLNGVFRLPESLKAEISPATWDMCIDDTFEIQIKTMFFEGWHEIEHDMRYKGEDLWQEYPGYSRYFNSILATLELCDKSMVTLFEDLGHDLYKSGQWTDMIRSHFRLKMSDMPIYPEVEQILDEDQKDNVNSLAKQIYKTSRAFLIDQLLKRVRKIPINVNTIIALLNDSKWHDGRLTKAFRERDVYNDGREEMAGESRHYEMRPLIRNDVFRIRTWVDGNRLNREEAVPAGTIFFHAAQLIYRWVSQRYGDLFKDMPAEMTSWKGDRLAYHVDVIIRQEDLFLSVQVQHLDLEVGGRIWYADCMLAPDEQKRMILTVRNGFAEPKPEHVVQDTKGMFFSYPGFYKMIVDNVGIFNGTELSNRRRILKTEQLDSLVAALKDPERVFPVILIMSRRTEDDLMDEDWLGQFRVSDFTRTVWRYTHVFTCYEEVGRQLLERIGAEYAGSWDAVPGFYIFWPDGETEKYGPEDVSNCSFGRHLEAKDDARTYDIVHGGQAFYHQIVTDLRAYNVAAVTQGFKEDPE